MAASDPQDESAGSLDWESVLRQHDRWLRTAVYARLGERQAVEDVMQEVCLAAVAQQAPIDHPEKVPGWLYRVAIRQTLLYRRRKGRERSRVARYAEQNATAQNGRGSHDPLAWLLSDERNRLIRESLEQLSRRDREILMLKYTENWSYHELAHHLDLSHSAVEARLHRARRRLRAELARRDVIEGQQ